MKLIAFRFGLIVDNSRLLMVLCSLHIGRWNIRV